MYNSHSIFAVSSLDLTQPFKGVGTGTFIMSMLQMKKLRLRACDCPKRERLGAGVTTCPGTQNSLFIQVLQMSALPFLGTLMVPNGLSLPCF